MGRKGEYEHVQSEYVRIIREIMEHIYPSNPHPRLADYEQAVAEYKNRYERQFAPVYTKRSVHTQVYRAIKELERLKEIVHEEKYYYPADMYTFHTNLEDFKKNVRLSQREVAMISGTTHALSLEVGQDIDQAKKSVTSFLGEKNIFSLLVIDNVLIIIMNRLASKEYLAEFGDLIKKTYDYQHPSTESSKHDNY